MEEDNGHANTINAEHCLRSSNFLLIIRVKTIVSI